jgi:hypothetical protein
MPRSKMKYGGYQFLPAPLITYNVEHVNDEQEQLLFRNVTYTLTGTLLFPSGDFGVMMGMREALEDALASGNQLFLVEYDNVPLISGYPSTQNITFEEGVWVDRINYTAELLLKDTSAASGNIESYSETWTFSEDDNTRTITVEHSAGAKGVNTAGAGSNNALENAKDYVVALLGYSNVPSFLPAFCQGSGTLQAYELLRSESADAQDGSYEANESFVLSSGAYIHRQSITFTKDESNAITVDLDGEVRGLGRSYNGYINASVGWGIVQPGLFTTASGVYAKYGGAKNLSSSEVSQSIGEDRDGGIITYAIGYQDSELVLPSGIVSFEMTTDHVEPVTLYAVHTVVDKADGPVVQDLGTSTEGTVTVAGTCVKESAFSVSDMKNFVNQKIADAAPTSPTITYRVTDNTYRYDDNTNTLEFSVTWSFAAAAQDDYLTYL